MQFAALRDRLETLDRPRGRVLEILIARLTAVIWNTSFGMDRENQKETKDFLVTRDPEAKPQRKPRMTKKYRRETAANWKMGFEWMLTNQKLKQHKN